jgi:hypothetical protein
MPKAKCRHDKEAPLVDIDGLPNYQGQEARHKCAVCAYDAGYNKGVDVGFKEGMQRGAHAVLILSKAMRGDDIEALTTAVAHANFILQGGGEEAG